MKTSMVTAFMSDTELDQTAPDHCYIESHSDLTSKP